VIRNFKNFIRGYNGDAPPVTFRARPYAQFNVVVCVTSPNFRPHIFHALGTEAIWSGYDLKRLERLALSVVDYLDDKGPSPDSLRDLTLDQAIMVIEF
jgi:hypothetical protein